MTHLFFALVAMTLVLTAFHDVYCLSGINRCYLGLYKGIVERCVVAVKKDGEYMAEPHIYIPMLEKAVGDYFLSDLKPYCRDYSYTCEGMLFTLTVPFAYCPKAKITFTAVISDTRVITKTAIFAVERNEHDQS